MMFSLPWPLTARLFTVLSRRVAVCVDAALGILVTCICQSVPVPLCMSSDRPCFRETVCDGDVAGFSLARPLLHSFSYTYPAIVRTGAWCHLMVMPCNIMLPTCHIYMRMPGQLLPVPDEIHAPVHFRMYWVRQRPRMRIPCRRRCRYVQLHIAVHM